MNVPEISDAPETPPPLSGTVSDKDPLFNDVSDEEYSTPPPESNSDVVIKEWHLHTVALMLRSMSPEALVAKLKHTGEYIGGENMSVRLDAATLDERGRFMTPASGTEPAQELRWSYAAKGRSAFGFVNGKTGNAFPPQWANNSTCPSTVELIRSNSHNKSATCERKGYKGAVTPSAATYECDVRSVFYSDVC
ncbi:unnamed protein product [Tilletia caries]|uniref:SCP domain-containing protein n=1 Tax=Tilletia caries TaxID=13290 RepID=A0ABN7IZ61_9BASI|nr:unnamed protein product [Tilletia caries]